MNDDKRAELLMDHYNTTFEHILYHWKTRNRLFAFILVVLAIMALDAAKPHSLANLGNHYIEKTFVAEPAKDTAGANAQVREWLDFSAVGSLSWFVLLCLVIQYYQRSIHVDRQYKYVAHVEEDLCELIGSDSITREGKSYRTAKGIPDATTGDTRPLYLKTIGPLYVYVFPLLLSAIVIGKLWLDWHSSDWGFANISSWLNFGFGLAIVIYSLLYIVWVKWGK